ncbi:hypothetical protein R1flu_014762 [Riccia fluitans]|uniref:TLC domain-containing protein n=1 Tax=Riccia fluitans TaxID=41844 RepID=A0ABD1YH13_9MARC
MLAGGSMAAALGTVWDTESYPEWQDFRLICLAAVACPLVRFVLDVTVFQRLAQLVIFPGGEINFKKIVRDARRKKIPKFMESAWKLTYYTAMVVLAVLVTYKEPWFTNTDACWHGWPNQSMKFPLKSLYVVQSGFYLFSVGALLFWETRRKDFAVMMTHHIVTVGLLACSYITGFFRIGSMVLALHDVSDIFLESAKLCKYGGSELGASVLFGLFALSWVLLRLIYFPFWIIRSTSFESIAYFDKESSVHTFLYYMFNTLLSTLLVIHIYWWLLICRMISRQLQLQGKIPDDVRSDSDDD